jgi:hypothetical protein
MKKTSVLIILLFTCFGSFAQTIGNCCFDYKSSLYNLKGPVKSVQWSTTESEIKDKLLLYGKINSSELSKMLVYSEFRRDGMIEKQIGGLREFVIKDESEYITTTYNYDSLKSCKYQCSLKHYFPVHDSFLFYMRDNSYYLSDDDAYFWDSYVYKYDKDGKIITQKLFSKYDADEVDEFINEQYLFYTVDYIYDNKSRVICQKITRGAKSKGMPFDIFGTETSFCSDTRIEYAYDENDRIIQVLVTSCQQELFKQDYTYNAKEDYVEKVKTHCSGPSRYFIGNWQAFYNKYGDVTKFTLIPYENRNDPDHPVLTTYASRPITQYYQYEYDSYGNWVEATIKDEGDPEGENKIKLTRKILYYK